MQNRVHYKNLTPPPARRKAEIPMFPVVRCLCPHRPIRILALNSRPGDLIDDRTPDRSFLPPVLSGTEAFGVLAAQIRADGFRRRRPWRRRLRPWPLAGPR